MTSVDDIVNSCQLQRELVYYTLPHITRKDFIDKMKVIPGSTEKTKSYIIKYVDFDVIIGFYDNEEPTRIVISFDHQQYMNRGEFKSQEENVLSNLYFNFVKDYCIYTFPSTDDPLYKQFLQNKNKEE